MNLVDELKQCTTVEETIKKGWLFRASRCFSKREIQEAVEQRKDEIREKELFVYQDRVLYILFKMIKEKDNFDLISTISTMMNLPEWKIFDILLLTRDNKKCDFNLSEFYEEEKKKDLLLEDANIILDIYLKMKPQERSVFFQKTKCSIEEFNKAIELVKGSEKYQEYLKAKEEVIQLKLMEMPHPNKPIPTQKDRLSHLTTAKDEQLYQYFDVLEKKSYTKLFCDMIGICSFVFEIIWEKDREYAMFLLSLPKEEQQVAMMDYQGTLKLKLLKSIDEMKEILKKEKCGQGEVPMFDAYNFYKNGFEINTSYSLLSLENEKKARTILSQFERYHHNYFESYKERELNTYRRFGRMTLGSQSVIFTNNQFNHAVKKIEEEHLPNKKGILLQLLKIEKEKQDGKKIYQKV